MRKYPHILLLLCLCALPIVAHAEDVMPQEEWETEEVIEQTSSLKANLNRLAIEYNQNTVTNKDEEDEYPDTFNADEQEVFTGIFDGNLEYNTDNLVWVNSLFMEYGKNKTTEDGVTTTSEKADKILLTTDYTHKMWHLEQGIIGPFVSMAYQTEFTTFTAADGDDYRTQILRGKYGLKVYESKYIKELYVAGVTETDFTYGDLNVKNGFEVGYKFAYDFREDLHFISDGLYRRFYSYSQYERTDYEYEFETNNRIDVDITNGLSFAPFINYQQAKTRGASKERSDTTVGISLGYKNSFQIW